MQYIVFTVVERYAGDRRAVLSWQCHDRVGLLRRRTCGGRISNIDSHAANSHVFNHRRPRLAVPIHDQ